MIREIKFRAWDREKKDFVYSGDRPSFSFWKWVDYDMSTPLMQFTGLKDKNGKEIYSGDILQFYKEYTTEHKLKPLLQEVGWLNQGWVPYSMEDGEIVGNIYEHPDLLKRTSRTRNIFSRT